MTEKAGGVSLSNAWKKATKTGEFSIWLQVGRFSDILTLTLNAALTQYWFWCDLVMMKVSTLSLSLSLPLCVCVSRPVRPGMCGETRRRPSALSDRWDRWALRLLHRHRHLLLRPHRHDQEHLWGVCAWLLVSLWSTLTPKWWNQRWNVTEYINSSTVLMKRWCDWLVAVCVCVCVCVCLQVYPVSASGGLVSEYAFVRTGLLGFIGPGGLVFITGKMDGLIMVSGRRHNADDIVATALAVEPMKFVYRGRWERAGRRDENVCVRTSGTFLVYPRLRFISSEIFKENLNHSFLFWA